MKKRLAFKKGRQRQFIERVNLILPLQDMAHLCGYSIRTIRDWRREKFLIDYAAAKKLSRKSGIPIPRCDIREIRDQYWYTGKGASRGGYAVLQKYGHIGGDPEYRNAQWRAWWEREGQFKPHPLIYNPLPVRLPRKSIDLAEFVGIVLGDGSISKRQITITVHSTDDKAYSRFIRTLIKKLFDISAGTYLDINDHALSIIISRTKLVSFFVEKLGLKIGNKVRQQIDIPDWIKENHRFARACVRGLVDTDGSVITHRYKVGGKEYSYKKIEFCSHSEPLRQSVFVLLRTSGIKVRLSNRYSVWIDSQKDLGAYFRIIGSHNPKHLIRLKN